MVADMLDKGARINARNKRGQTALMQASLEGYLEVVQTLLDKGADVNAKENEGYTAMMMASSKGHNGVAKVLLNKGTNPKDNLPSRAGRRMGIVARIGCFILSFVLFGAPICCCFGLVFMLGHVLVSIHKYAPAAVVLLCIGMAKEFWPLGRKVFLSAIRGDNPLGK